MRLSFLICGTILAVLIGCGRHPADPQAELSDGRGGTASELSPLPVDQHSGPDIVVAAFLSALRDGNDQIAEALLTDVARREVAEHGLKVRPPGSPNSTYQIVNVRPAKAGTQVESVWTEYTPSGEPVLYNILWVLRRQPNGWRVAGMATAPDPNGPPIFLNFEDVTDLLGKWQQVDAELAAQSEPPAATQADQGGSPVRR